MMKKIDSEAFQLLEQDSKIGVLATLDESGYPHLTFLSSIQALDETHLAFGQFCSGLSKRFILERPEVGFLALDAQKRYLCGHAAYTHSETSGEIFDLYNAKPLFRYNSYMGFSQVHFFDLLDVTRLSALPMGAVVFGALCSRVKALFCSISRNGALPQAGIRLISELDSLKFLCYPTRRGRLRILPVIQATAAGSDRIVFAGVPFGDERSAVPDGCKASILCVNLKMESVLVKGAFHPGRLDVERVYNSMPPKMEYVYPRPDALEAITAFEPECAPSR